MLLNLREGEIAECKLFECPIHGGNLCCTCCAKKEDCLDSCLNHPNKCNEAVLVTD